MAGLTPRVVGLVWMGMRRIRRRFHEPPAPACEPSLESSTWSPRARPLCSSSIVRRALKFLHEIATVGLMGALVAQLILAGSGAALSDSDHAVLRAAILLLSKWLLLPSLGLVLATGLFALAVHPPYHNARWAWLKAATTLLILEGTLGGVQGTARDAAELARRVAAGDGGAAAALQQVLTHERGATWVILLLALLNVALGVWRPRLRRRPRPEPPSLAG